MTPDEIRKMGSGMPLDRLVEAALHPDQPQEPPPNYSGMGAGWEFWAMLAWAEQMLLWFGMDQLDDHQWEANLFGYDERTVAQATAPTLPHAVALAVALAAAKEGVTT